MHPYLASSGARRSEAGLDDLQMFLLERALYLVLVHIPQWHVYYHLVVGLGEGERVWRFSGTEARCHLLGFWHQDSDISDSVDSRRGFRRQKLHLANSYVMPGI